MKFKVGDKIRHTYRYGVGADAMVNQLGTIVSVKPHDAYGVEFDNYMGGHYCDGDARDGHGWNISSLEIVLVKKRSVVGNSKLEFNWP